MKPEQPGSFTPISPNPYIVGNPVRDRHMFFGREAEFDLVKKRFVESRAKGGLLIFCGERRSGKTSILFQIDEGRLGPEFVPVLIDMQSMAVESETDFLVKVGGLILERMGSTPRIHIDALIGAKRPAAAFLNLVQAALVEHPDRKLILLVDEYELFENKIKDGVISEEVLQALAHLTENQSVFLVFTGSLSLDERHQEYWKVFLGRSTFRRISFLERRDAVSLITEPLAGRVQYEDGVVESIFRLTAGQPFYTQAVCQSIVDQLNEHQTTRATDDILKQVVDGIVAQPFPQMTFRWEELEDNEKLVLALLAETLTESRSTALVKDVMQTLARGRYPLRLGEGSIADALENLFKKEILLLFESGPARSYAFRVDLWRHWIRRMHTVWQVMRELGMEIRPEAKRKQVVGRMIGVSVILVAALGVAWLGRDWFRPAPSRSLPIQSNVAIRTNLADAQIWMGGERVGLGSFLSSLPSGQHDVAIRRDGYQSESLSVALPAGGSLDTTIILVPLMGNLHIDTSPPGADLFVDEAPAGRSPRDVGGLRVNQAHAVRAVLAGYDPQVVNVTVLANVSTSINILLSQSQATMVIRSDPTGADLFLDDAPFGKTTRYVTLPLGRHRFRVEYPGYVTKDTTCVLNAAADLMFVLAQRPKGRLRIQGEGDVYATMYVGDKMVQRSHTRWDGAAYDEGTYRVRIDFDDPNRPDTTFEVPVQSGCETVFNYITGAHEIKCP
jgi:PEGA domain-containing protein